MQDKVNLNLSREEIMKMRTSKGGWTKSALASLGVKWPPQKGWLEDYLKRAGERLASRDANEVTVELISMQQHGQQSN